MVQRIMIGLFLVSLASAQNTTASAQASIENRDVLSPAMRRNYSRQMVNIKIPDTRDRQNDDPNVAIDRTSTGNNRTNEEPGDTEKAVKIPKNSSD